MNFWGSKQKESLLLDFGSGSVKGCIFERNKDGNNIVKDLAVVKLDKYGVFDGHIAKARVKQPKKLIVQDFNAEVTRTAAERVMAELGLKNINKINTLVGLPADCLKARVVKVSVERGAEAKRINEKEAKAIFQTIFEEAKSKIAAEFGPAAQPYGLKFLRARVLAIKISGYNVPTIIGFRGRVFNVQVLVIFCLRAKWLQFKQVLESFKPKRMHVFHEAEGLIKCPKIVKEHNIIFADIGSLFTKFFIFRGKSLEATGEWPQASYDLSLALQAKLKMSEGEAQEIMFNLTQGVLTPKIAERINKLLAPVADIWWGKMKTMSMQFGLNSAPVVMLGGGSFFPCFLQQAPVAGFSARILNINEQLPIVNLSGKGLTPAEGGSLILSFSESAK
jgi:cell division ATPase FtsA